MDRLNHWLVAKKTKGCFSSAEIPSVYGVVECYRRFQKREFDRDLTFRKALNEFTETVFTPLKKEIGEASNGNEAFYPQFMKRTFELFGRNKEAVSGETRGSTTA